jgi:hypothetical protein
VEASLSASAVGAGSVSSESVEALQSASAVGAGMAGVAAMGEENTANLRGDSCGYIGGLYDL